MRYFKSASLLALYLLFLLLLAESASRAFLVYYKQTDFWHPQSLLIGYYPELKPALHAVSDASQFNILLLGGSVLNPDFSDIAKQLEENLAERHIPAHIYDIAWPAHTSLDSYFKYSLLAGHHFDLVLFYHAINEIRANNCPEKVYREDYSHFSWYREMWLFYNHYDELEYTALPYVASLFVLKLKGHLLRTRFASLIGEPIPVPTNMPRGEWVKYGSHVKTAEAFDHNVSKIAGMAKQRGEQLLLVSFATHLPDNYSQTRLQAGVLDYDNSKITGMPVEIWGDPGNVKKGIDVHNRVLRGVAASHPEVNFFDMEVRLSNQGSNFIDICHFSQAGSTAFSALITPVVAQLLYKPD